MDQKRYIPMTIWFGLDDCTALMWAAWNLDMCLQAWPIMVAHSPQATKNVCGRPEVPQALAHVASKKM